VTYDRQGRQHLHVSFEGVVTEHVYSETDGRLVAKRFFDNLQQYDGGAGTPGEVWTYTHDAFGRPDSPGPLDPENLDTNLSDNQPLARFEYTVRADGRRTGLTETFWLDADSDPQTAPTPHVNRIDWTYDDIGRLTDEAFNHFDDDLDRIESFVYDLASNRVEKWLNTDPQFDENGVPAETIAHELVASLYDANDRLIESLAYTAPDPQTPGWTAQDGDLVQTTTYGYAQTQQTVKEVENAVGQRISKLGFAYDLQGRLWRATTEGYTAGELSSRERVTYDYDATGIRIGALAEIDSQLDPEVESWQPATRTEFLVDHRNFTGYQQVIKETTYDDQDAITKTIEYTIGLDEIAQTVTPYAFGQPDAESAETHIFAHDGHGSVRVLFDLAATAVQFYAFDAYGQMLAIWNATAQMISGGNGQYAEPRGRPDQSPLRGRTIRHPHEPAIPQGPLLRPHHRPLQPPGSVLRESARPAELAQVPLCTRGSGEWRGSDGIGRLLQPRRTGTKRRSIQRVGRDESRCDNWGA
jgi:hypothetical protein